MEFTYTEKDLASRENFLTAAGQFYNLYEQVKREEEERLRLAKKRDSALDAAMAKIEEFLRLFWRVENSEDEEVLYYTLKLLRKELMDLAAIDKTEDGIKDTDDGVWAGHHTSPISTKSTIPTKSPISTTPTKYTKATVPTKPNQPTTDDKTINPIKIKRHNEPITFTAHSNEPINFNILPKDALSEALNKIFESAARSSKEESNSPLEELIDKLMK